MELVSKYCDRLNYAIANSGLRQSEIARRTGISRSLLNKYTVGDCNASLSKLVRLAKELNVNPVWLLGFDSEMVEQNKGLSTTLEIINELCSKQDEQVQKKILKVIRSMIED